MRTTPETSGEDENHTRNEWRRSADRALEVIRRFKVSKSDEAFNNINTVQVRSSPLVSSVKYQENVFYKLEKLEKKGLELRIEETKSLKLG